jgi:hypothetical protein
LRTSLAILKKANRAWEPSLERAKIRVRTMMHRNLIPENVR